MSFISLTPNESALCIQFIAVILSIQHVNNIYVNVFVCLSIVCSLILVNFLTQLHELEQQCTNKIRDATIFENRNAQLLSYEAMNKTVIDFSAINANFEKCKFYCHNILYNSVLSYKLSETVGTNKIIKEKVIAPVI